MRKLTMFAALALTSMVWGGVARIGSDEYDTLDAAFKAAQDGDLVEVLQDLTLSPWPAITTACTVDLGGHTLSGIYGQYNRTGGTCTIRNGTLTYGFDGKGGTVDVYPNGVTVFENVTMGGILWTDSHPVIIRSGTYNGDIRLGTQSLVVEGGDFKGNFVCDAKARPTLKGGRFAKDCSTVGMLAYGYQLEYNEQDEAYPYVVSQGSVVRAQWTGLAGDGDFANSGNWSCVDAQGLTLSAAVPSAAGTALCLQGDTTFNCPAGSMPQWRIVTFGPLTGAPTDKFGYFRRGRITQYWNASSKYALTNQPQTDDDFIGFPRNYLNFVGDIAMPADFSNTLWKESYMGTSTACAEGWFYVRDDQAGRWIASLGCDDFVGIAIDDTPIAARLTYVGWGTGNTFLIEPGWHKYAVLVGDTWGGYDATNPIKISINGGEQVYFNEDTFTFGDAENTVRLMSDCDWRGLGMLEMPAGLTLDLNGHNLAIAGAKGTFKNGVTITGDGTLTVDGGSFDDNGIAVRSATMVFTNSVVTKATWTAAGAANNVNDPANWACQDADGHVVSGGVPGAATVVEFDSAAATLQLPEGQTLTTSYLQPSTDLVTLAADLDWRGALTTTALPDTFDGVRLSYLEAPKGSFVNTGIKPNGNTRVAMDVTVQGTCEYWFGAWHKNDHRDLNFSLGNDGGEIYVAYQYQNLGHGSGSLVPNGRHVVELNRGYFALDGELKVNRFHANFTVNYPLYLFAQNRAGTAGTKTEQNVIRFHECWIYDNGALVRHFVPVQKSNGTVGVFDLVNNTFYGNGGSGTFAAGPVGYSKAQASLIPRTTVNLAGHALDLAPSADVFATTICDADSPANAPGTLRLHVTADKNFSTTEFTLDGNLKVVVDAAGTEYELGTKLVGLDGVPPASVTFELDPITAAHGVNLVTSEYGVFYGADPNSPNAVYAHWTGAAGDGDPLNGANWCATNLAGRAIASPVLNMDTDVFFHEAATLKVPAEGLAWKQLLLADGELLTLDLTDWTGSVGDPIISTLLGFTPATELWSRIRVVNPRYDVALSMDGRSLLTIAKSTLAWRHQKYGVDRAVMTEDCSFRFMPLSSYTTLITPTNAFSALTLGYKTTWQATYLSQSQNRLDGWFLVSSEQAGTWNVDQVFDDYEAWAIDGEWKILNPTYTHGANASFEISAGWHHFTIVLGDTFGGYGGSGSSIMVTMPGQETAVAFDERGFTFDDPSALTAGDFAITQKGEVPVATFEVAADCRLVLDPAETRLMLQRAPTFENGAKIALAAKYAAATSGSFTLMTWEKGAINTYGVPLKDIFDATSANGANPMVQVVDEDNGTQSLRLSLDGGNDAVTAHWLGAVDGDCTKPENWACVNAAGEVITAVPGWGTAVYIDEGACNLSVPAGTPFPHGTVTVGSAIALSCDCDWRGLDVAAASILGRTIDVKGHAFYISAGIDLTAGTVTSSAADGTFHLDVPANVTVANTGLALTGSLQLVKEGAGTYLAKCKNQTYTGGNLIAGGISMSPLSSSNSVAEWSPWGTYIYGARGSTFTVMPGAMLDMDGNYDYRGFITVLAGGTLRASGRDMANTTWGCCGGFTLTADSTYVIDTTIVHNDGNQIFNLNGHMLDIRLANGKYWKPTASSFTNGGKVKISLDGSAITDGRFWNYGDITAPTVDFDLGCRIEVKNNMTVHDFTCRTEGTWGWSEVEKKVSVFGTFTPVSDYFCNVELQNGASIDLSNKPLNWSTLSLDHGNEKNFYTTFAEGASIGVKLGSRKFNQGDCVIAWDEQPVNVRFRCLDAHQCSLAQRSDGLYVYTGFAIFFK